MITPSDRLALFFDPAHTEHSAEVVRRYYAPHPGGSFTGAYFERLGGGGDRPEIADVLTAEDLVAVSMLSVRVDGRAALELLVHRRERLSELLAKIPTDVRLGQLAPDDLGDGWPVRALYGEISSVHGLGATITTKLMARKRPHLVPVFDAVVDVELSLVQQRLWGPLHAWLVADGHSNERQLARIREASGIGDDVSLLRVFDVLTWMVGSGYAVEPGATAPDEAVGAPALRVGSVDE